jgi:hypothetical protein
MFRGSFQRAAMTILLMGLMIAPLRICLEQSPKSAHSCCMQPASRHSLRTDCCVVRTQLPATLVTPTLPGPSANEVLHEDVASLDAAITDVFPAVAVIPPLSPPTGAFILRI